MFQSKGVFRLFNVKLASFKEFLSKYNFSYQVSTDDDGVCFKYDLSGLSPFDMDLFYKSFIKEFGNKIYAETDISLINQLFTILRIRGLKISVAESFTGGRISSLITSISGASEIFYEGIVCYNELSKNRRLGVKEETLKRKNPVSEEVAHEMCLGLLNGGLADISLSTTGIAGPNSDSSGYPVGLCYFGVATKNKSAVYKYMLSGTRDEIINKGVKTALFLTIKALRDGSFDV